MPTSVIEIAGLREIDEQSVKDLAEYLEEKTEANAEVTKTEITLNFPDEKEGISKAYLRVLLRKFLHREELKEELRVISGPESVFIIKERK
jgi:hypothetical protein